MIIRLAQEQDLPAILRIYNQGIEDRIATLETEVKDDSYMQNWFAQREPRYAVLVACAGEQIVGWASINPYNKRFAYYGVGELSVYIDRTHRGRGVGKQLLGNLERIGREQEFHKFILFTFPFNSLGQGLYRNSGYREVGVFHNQGRLDGEFVDVMAMEKLLLD
ncbi:N-acetyltransferase [Tumebacillus sp. ITR2]|uniref:N-acetyltransferase n=1 Tax=Tumebacillus amylolyticus TaxID=2801339 RepID=A0ABS1JGJ8_9BACL|nr:arsinothricin resistance N-acetyltransferase ArsN1 family A [Tumebacillus amylolyticus]MBL0389134.1 N-acetyltransferase [Tumebacillus amylolyticus]